ncbi:cytolethal distending toxin subunit B family protein [Psychromonas aquimarina]|uniref:cytolethal distending toxin subunit B family protein n=1 Tax=Psychromonas aquimarina TaxID=444919 RepID=UPI00040D5A85|nr:cytolethal distending toxin subunit B family protein [Psychromonas aquimarina]
MFLASRNITAVFLLFYLYFGSVQASNDIRDFKAGNWNMQGAAGDIGSRWTNEIRRMVTGISAIQVLSLQESGHVPNIPEMRILPTPGSRLGLPLDGGEYINGILTEHSWDIRSRATEDRRYVYHIDHDTGAGRVNVAIVSESRASRVIILPPAASYPAVRPILGIQVGGVYFFSIHASASGGVDAVGIIRRIRQYFIDNNLQKAQFMILGDYNVDPETLRRRLERYPDLLSNLTIFAPDEITHLSATTPRTLNYSVAGSLSGNGGLLGALTSYIMPDFRSDHIAVSYRRQ